MRIRRIVFLAGLLLIGFVSGAAVAATNIEKVEAFIRRDFTVYVDGKKTDTQVLVYNSRAYLHLGEIGKALGAEVRWDERNKSIYVTPVRYILPDPEQNPNIASITMTSVQGFLVSYLGKTVPVLGIQTTDYSAGFYYRVKDLKELNVNLTGLQLVEEARTKELYVSAKELEKVWSVPPSFSYVYDKLVFGKFEKEQMEVVEDYIRILPDLYKAMKTKDPVFPELDYVPYITVYSIDALPNNEFRILALESAYGGNYYMHYWLKLDKNVLDKWYRKEEKITNLGPMFPQNNFVPYY